MKPSESSPALTVLAKLREVTGDAKAVAAAIAALEPDLDDPIVAERVRETLHQAATRPRPNSDDDDSENHE